MTAESTADVVRAHVWVSGRVQGVYFRETARQQAIRLGITGWVANLTDGRVEILVEGMRTAVLAFIDWAHRGPPSARVERVDSQLEPPTGEFTSFQVRHR